LGVTEQHVLLDPMDDSEHQQIAGVLLDVVRTGEARVKRVVYPAGLRWSVDLKAVVGTDLCQHAHVGFLAQGEIRFEYPDGCVVHCIAPQAVAIEPGHDAEITSDVPAVLIEFDFEGDTVGRIGLAGAHAAH